MRKAYLGLFEVSGVMAKPWRDAGFECWIYDTQHKPGVHFEDGMYKVGFDLSEPPDLPSLDWKFVACFPPCTDVAVSGARWFKGKGLRALQRSIGFFATSAEVCESIGAPYFIENPVSTISSYWRKPDFSFDPCDYGDPYTKKTCLWVGGGFQMPKKNRVEPTEGSKMHRVWGGSDGGANTRSETPKGFAEAVFLANKDGVKI